MGWCRRTPREAPGGVISMVFWMASGLLFDSRVLGVGTSSDSPTVPLAHSTLWSIYPDLPDSPTSGAFITPEVRMAFAWSSLGRKHYNITAPVYDIKTHSMCGRHPAYLTPSNPVGIEELVTGHHVLVHRGHCSFLEKAENANLAGAASVIIVDDWHTKRHDAPLINMQVPEGQEVDLPIPVVFISHPTYVKVVNATTHARQSGDFNFTLASGEATRVPPPTKGMGCFQCIVSAYRWCGVNAGSDEQEGTSSYCDEADMCDSSSHNIVKNAGHCTDVAAGVAVLSTLFMMCCIVPLSCVCLFGAMWMYLSYCHKGRIAVQYSRLNQQAGADDRDALMLNFDPVEHDEEAAERSREEMDAINSINQAALPGGMVDQSEWEYRVVK